MTPADKRRRYRTDPEFRSAILESNRRSRARDTNPNRARLNRLAADICRLRESIERQLREVARCERRLIKLTAEREKLKTERANKHPRRHAEPPAAGSAGIRTGQSGAPALERAL